jgi:hypothetical protein
MAGAARGGLLPNVLCVRPGCRIAVAFLSSSSSSARGSSASRAPWRRKPNAGVVDQRVASVRYRIGRCVRVAGMTVGVTSRTGDCTTTARPTTRRPWPLRTARVSRTAPVVGFPPARSLSGRSVRRRDGGGYQGKRRARPQITRGVGCERLVRGRSATGRPRFAHQSMMQTRLVKRASFRRSGGSAPPSGTRQQQRERAARAERALDREVAPQASRQVAADCQT